MLVGAIALLTGLAALYAAWPIWRAFLPLEIDVNEPWNAYHADAVREGWPLYPDPDGLIFNNYPPLSFYLLAGLSAAGVDAIYIGRLLSLLSVGGTAVAVAFLIRGLGGSRTAALFGAVWFLATLTRFVDGYVGMNDPNLVGLAFMAWGMVWLQCRRAAGLPIDPAIIVMAIAGFYKHNLMAIPVTAIIWLGWTDRRAALRAFVVGAVTVMAGFAVCVVVYGTVFFESLLMAREYSIMTAMGGLGRLQGIAPALIIVAVWAWYKRQGDAVRFTATFVAVTFVFQFLQKLGIGVADNAQFELIVATAVGIGLAFQDVAAFPWPPWLSADKRRLVIVLILIARLLLWPNHAPYLLIASPEFRAQLRERSAIAASEVARIAAIPGPVICSVSTVCRWAGKPHVFDAFFVNQSITTGARSQSDVTRLRQALGAREEAIDPRTVAHWR